MPNWCNNVLELKHSDSAMIERAVKAGAEGRLLAEFYPVPEELVNTVSGYSDEVNAAKRETNVAKYGYADWYDWSVNNWGTKWDVECYSVDKENDNTASLVFDSAWAPPVAWCAKMEELGFEVKLHYYECGMGFAGTYSEGVDDYFEFGELTSEEVNEMLPEELNSAFNISDSMAEWEEENE